MSVCFACDAIKVPVFAVVFQKSLCKQYRNGWLFDSYVKLKPAFELRKIYTEIKTDSGLSHFPKKTKPIYKNRTICNNIQSYVSIRHSLQCRNKVKLYIWTISFSSNKNIKKLKAYIMINLFSTTGILHNNAIIVQLYVILKTSIQLITIIRTYNLQNVLIRMQKWLFVTMLPIVSSFFFFYHKT